jgi:beta-lactamase regulating signal transducer with metallopeptidase domain
MLARPDAIWVLAHERAHMSHFDPAWLTLAATLRAALFFQPAIYWLANRLDLEQELAADEMVVEGGADRRAYARTLLDWAEEQLERPRWIPVSNLSRTPLEGRVRRVLTARSAPVSRVRVVMALLLVTVALTTLGRGVPAIAVEGSNGHFERETEISTTTQP